MAATCVVAALACGESAALAELDESVEHPTQFP